MTIVSCVLWMNRLAGVAALVNACELLVLSRVQSRSLTDNGVWRASTLSREWGLLRYLLGPRAFGTMMFTQAICAVLLAVSGGALYAGVLLATTLLSAVRFRGTVNGGSDAMLFNVLGGLMVAQMGAAAESVREGAVLYVAAQLTLSYLRAGIVKVRQPSWWTGDALRAFLALPAYGVPMWVPRESAALRAVGIAVMAFECLAAVAWVNPIAAAGFIAVAIAFHAGTALLFGLNRFFLAWTAALPALWYAVHRV